MGRSLTRRSVTGVLCMLLVVCGALAVVNLSVSAWANRGQQQMSLRETLEAGDREFAKRFHKPFGYARPEAHAVLGRARPDWEVSEARRADMIETSLGFLDADGLDRLRRQVPDLAGPAGRALQGARGELVEGFNALQISRQALGRRSLDDIAADLAGLGAEVHGVLESRSLLVHLTRSQIAEVERLGVAEQAIPWIPALRIDSAMGRSPMIQRERAESPMLRLVVQFFDRTDPGQARRDLEAIAGAGKVAAWSLDGLSFETTVHVSKVAQIARLQRVRYLYETPEFLLMNAEIPTTAMVGNVRENLPFQKPYHDAGVDGGGLDLNADGRRLNDGTDDPVPPQIVAVTDNGLSYDSIQFSQTATQPETGDAPAGTRTHRKVHAIQNVADGGSTCDATLSGSGTHGNVVAGVIAADSSSLGFRASKHIYNSRPRVDGLELDGLARGARILMQDAAAPSVCTSNDLVEKGGNVSPGSLLDRLNLAICPTTGSGAGACSGVTGGGGEVHLHVMPFGVPNFDNIQANPTDGTYTPEARQIDTFLVNNRDYMVFAPVGNQGTERTPYFSPAFTTQPSPQYPDLFDGTSADDDPNFPQPIQVSPPATAKNLVSVGAHYQDTQTQQSQGLEEAMARFSSKGPATAGSLRMAPMIVGVGADVTGFFFGPNTTSVAVVRSTDNDNLGPVEAVLDDINFGTSFASAEVTGVGALIRDYFAQGFYPTGARVAADRLPSVSGPLVKAMIGASANFLEELGTSYPTLTDQAVGFARAVNLTNVGGVNVGIIGNSEQGYGRPVVTSVLPLANWPTSKGVGINNTLEYPAAGLLIYDEIATGEPAINNTTRLSIDHTFTVDSDSTRTVLIGGVSAKIVDRGQLRIAVAWSDPPTPTGTSGALVNDLDLEVESPGPDGSLSAAADNVIYDGNNYRQGSIRQGQWSLGRAPGGADVGDRRNPIEAVHLSADPDGDGNVADSQLFAGIWRVRVKRGAGGATAGQITILTGTGPAGAGEDVNRNGRLDTGEDTDGDGFLDADGQPYGLAIAGPVIGSGSQTFNGTSHAFPASVARLNKSLFGCADEARLTVFDPGTTSTAVSAAVTFEVVTRSGAVVDEERGLTFTASTSNTYVSGGIPVRDGRPAAIRFNGILETSGPGPNEPYSVRARYTDTPREAVAAARVSCGPNLVAWRFLGIPNENGTQQVAIGGGCDQDQFMDSGENVTYAVTFGNSNRDHDLTDVQATLSVGGPGGGAVRVLNSPQNLGRIPGGQITAASFILRVDPAALAAIAVNNRLVDMTVTLRASTGNVQLERQTFTFRHALNSDYETFHYSTDHPGGAREIRDFNRNLQIDTPDMIDPFIGIQIPDEDATFSTMFIQGSPGGVVTNILGEDLNNNGVLDTATERDIIPNGVLDRGILASASGPTPGVDKAPFTFDSNSGGFAGFRSAYSRPGGSTAQVWEHVRTGICGFQSAIPDGDPAIGFQNNGAGVWHTGDGSPTTPTTACENHAVASEAGTPPGQEFFQDFLVSPIIAKVHQANDARGLPFTVEFQRLGYNTMVQTIDDQPGGNVNVDNNVDDDGPNCLLCQDFDFRYGGIDYMVAGWVNSGDVGTCPNCVGIPQRTFGLTDDPDGSVTSSNKSLTGDETGFTAFTQNSNPLSSNPIPPATPALLPYPLADAPTVFASDGVTPWTNNVAGPVRNFDLTLINYAAGFNSLMQGSTGQEVPSVVPFDVNPGVRWQVAFGFFHIEGGANLADYGIGVDDVVFEWDERHPVDEAALGHTAACQRFGQPGQAAGAQCATLSVDRGGLFECEDAMLVSVYDPKRAGAGSVDVLAASDSDARPFSTGVVTALHPVKRFTLTEVSGSPGMFTGPIVVSQAINAPNTLFVSPATDNFVQVYYQDPQCDGNRTGVAGQNDFDNLDGDGVAFSVDNCPFDYNPGQGDPDGDGRGDGTAAGEMGCDNCPGVTNADQLDSDGDRVGDACDLDDIDFDGIVNAVDNCPDVYNPLQAPGGPSGKGLACDKTTDRDGDSTNDRNDNCVRTSNTLQEDSDDDGIGDACEGDCLGARRAELAIGSCSRSSAVECSAASPSCPTTGICQEDLSRVCTSSNQQCTCINIAPETCVLTGTINNTPRTCSSRDDDTDVDSVVDAVDNCPVKSNPPVVPGTSRQADTDNDNIGDACDSPFMVDGDNSGIPDDVVSFGLLVNCGKVPLPTLVVEKVDVLDLNGDHDVFCDTGERCEMTMTVFNASPLNLTDVTLFLATSDSDIQCVTRSSVNIGALAAGAKVDTSSIGGQRRAFEFVMSSASETTDAAQPLKGDFNLTLTSREAIGTRNKVGFQILLDLDLPQGVVVQKVVGPDGIGGTADDGLLFEDFDVDRDGIGGVDISDGREGVPNDTFGVTVGSAPGGINVIAAIGCGGYKVPPIDPGCRLDPDNDMSWHVHCPAGTCPQPHAVSAKGNLAITPTGGALARSGQNSLHWGRHTNAANRLGDTVAFREVAAFMTNPVNLTPFPISGDLVLTFYHIADMMDNNEADIPLFQSVDHGDVQIRVDRNVDPAADDWGLWDKLAPFENVYDHVPYIWSHWGANLTYCDLTPADTGTAPPAPRGVHETMCFPIGVWSHCGNAWGTTSTFQCPGPGVGGQTSPGGGALWVQSKFSLSNFLGARIQIRWIAQGWEFDFDNPSQDYQTYGGQWDNSINDDGWWVDDIAITGAITVQASPDRDPTGTLPPPGCPATPADACNPALGADRGFDPSLTVRDANNDGVIEKGEALELNASATANPGGCTNGVIQYRFVKNGVVVSDYSSNAFFRDAASTDTTYQVLARCSVNPACTTLNGASRSLAVYTGDGDDIRLDLTHDRATATTSLRWLSRPQPNPMSGYDVFRGTMPPKDEGLATLTTQQCDFGVGVGAGTLLSVPHATNPGPGQVIYFLVGHSNPTPGARTALGRHSNGSARIAPIGCP